MAGSLLGRGAVDVEEEEEAAKHEQVGSTLGMGDERVQDFERCRTAWIVDIERKVTDVCGDQKR